jgi:predicted DNA-binding protein
MKITIKKILLIFFLLTLKKQESIQNIPGSWIYSLQNYLKNYFLGLRIQTSNTKINWLLKINQGLQKTQYIKEKNKRHIEQTAMFFIFKNQVKKEELYRGIAWNNIITGSNINKLLKNIEEESKKPEHTSEGILHLIRMNNQAEKVQEKLKEQTSIILSSLSKDNTTQRLSSLLYEMGIPTNAFYSKENNTEVIKEMEELFCEVFPKNQKK